MPGKLDSICVAQQTSRSQIIGWQFYPFGVKAPSDAIVEIHRSSVENDGFSLVGRVPANQGWYQDESVDVYDRWELPNYKLVLIVDGETIEYPPTRVNGSTDVVARTLTKHVETYLKLAGIPVLVYQYLSNGDRCPDCWDAILQQPVTSNCDSCFGTGFLKGYHFPIQTLAVMGVEGKQNIVAERIEQELTIEMLFSNYPVLRPSDVIYEIDTGKRYRVQQVLPVEKHRALINQSAVGYALQTTDAEHDIPIPDFTKLESVLRRRYAPHRKVSSSNGESFDNQKFDPVPF